MNEINLYISEQAEREILLENERHPETECMCCGLGRRIENNFFYDRMIDSGMNATYEYAYCVKDHEYVDHVMNIVLQEYDIPEEEVSATQIHEHPKGCKRFSTADKKFNQQLAKEFGGVVAGLMWREPQFHMKFWYIDEEGNEYPANVYVDDQKVKEAMPKKDIRSLLRTLEEKTPKKEKSFEELMEEKRFYTVYYPKEYRDSAYTGPLYGFFHPETLTFNVVSEFVHKQRKDTKLIGYVRNEKTLELYETDKEKFLYGTHYSGKDSETEETVEFRIGNYKNPVLVDYYSLKDEAFSRNQTILEANVMKTKKATIIGVGSLGSVVACQLVKAGIGEVNLVEGDALSYTNLSRHVLGIPDIGRNKAQAMADYLLGINPECKVNVYAQELENCIPEQVEKMLEGDSILICCADNRHAAYVCNELADEYHVPMVAAGCGTRASTSEIFYYIPNTDMPCYECMFGPDTGVDLTNQAVSRRFYATERELEKLTFQPGMHLDISMAALVAAKLIIDLLMEGEEGYELKILPYMKQMMLMVNYAIDEEINPLMKLFEHTKDGGIKPFQWKNAAGMRNPKCTHCGSDEKC